MFGHSMFMSHDYRWPGYAIEGGEIFETAGCDDKICGASIQKWRHIDKLKSYAFTRLILQIKTGTKLGFSNIPSDGIIL
jgi:hypothetical protein